MITLASGASHLVIIGSHRDSLHPAVVSAPALFAAVPPAAKISPQLAAYLISYPDGPQL